MGIRGRRIDAAVMAEFWEVRSCGVSYPEAARQVGISVSAARMALVKAGGIRPRVSAPPSGRYLSAAEREEIALGLAGGLSNTDIAKLLGRHPATIGREIKRNQAVTHHQGCVQRDGVVYRGSTADNKAVARRRRPKPAKLAVNLELRARVQDMLSDKWSPEQIAATLKAEFPDRPEMWVSHETIYQSLYVQSRGALKRELTACLRTGRAIRRPKRRADERRGRIKDMVMVSERPAEAEDRAVPGHWEGDLILGKDNASAIGTLVERSTRYVMLLHLPCGFGAEQVRDAMIAAIAEMPEQVRRSLTWDQGTEMHRHAEITTATDLAIYFCDPHSPWQRGSNENTNGLLRQYFPKSTDLNVHSKQDLDFVADQLNRRPRKTLDWQNPRERLQQLLVATTD